MDGRLKDRKKVSEICLDIGQVKLGAYEGIPRFKQWTDLSAYFGVFRSSSQTIYKGLGASSRKCLEPGRVLHLPSGCRHLVPDVESGDIPPEFALHALATPHWTRGSRQRTVLLRQTWQDGVRRSVSRQSGLGIEMILPAVIFPNLLAGRVHVEPM